MKIKLSTLTALLIFIFSGPVAKAQVGQTAVPFLLIAPDSRATARGYTGVALANNPSAVFWNPAGLAFQEGTAISITHSQWLANFNADLFYDYLVAAHHVEGVGTFGAHITYLNLGEQLRTGPNYNPETGNALGRFNSYEFAIGLSYGFKISDNWALGTGVRYIHSSLFEGKVGGMTVSPGSSFGFDIAALYKSDPFPSIFEGSTAHFNVGINISNIGPGISYSESGVKDPLPTVLRFGWAFTTELGSSGRHTLTIANDISKLMVRTDSAHSIGPLESLITSWGSLKRRTGQGMVKLSLLEQFMVGFGAEYWYRDLFALRAGYYFEDPYNGNREFLTFGAGINYKFISVNFSYIYALEEQHPLANTTRFGLVLEF